MSFDNILGLSFAWSLFSVSALFSAKHLPRILPSVILHSPQNHSFPYSYHFWTHSCVHLFLPSSISFKHVYCCKHWESYSWHQRRQLHAVFPCQRVQGAEFRVIVPHAMCRCEGIAFLGPNLSCHARNDSDWGQWWFHACWDGHWAKLTGAPCVFGFPFIWKVRRARCGIHHHTSPWQGRRCATVVGIYNCS